ncbi:MAG TPA: hypothetical protein VMX54_15635 [Vicinamibacteria bacterium]|nr:hypothetical protein [Vicinamibacteria bacterium]
MTRPEALTTLRRLAAGLPADLAGQARLLERISNHDEAEQLRDALVELGASVLLDEQ